MVTAINLLLESFNAHIEKHKNSPTFKVNISTIKEASGKCNTCQTNFGVKG